MSEQITGFVKLYHPSGALVTVPVNCVQIDYGQMLKNVTSMLEAGFMVNAPGLDEGEKKEMIGSVVRREKDEQDGRTTAIIDLYPADGEAKFSMLTVYLNRPEDVSAFEYASGLKLKNIQLYIGANKIERGKSKNTDTYITKAPNHFAVIWQQNPKWSAEEAEQAVKSGKMYPVPKRRFVRWEAQKPVSEAKQQEPAAEEPKVEPPQQTEAFVRDWTKDRAKRIGLKPETVAVDQAIDDWKDYEEAMRACINEEGIQGVFVDRILAYCRTQWWYMQLASAGPNPETVQALVKDLVEDKILGGAAKSTLVAKFNEQITNNTPW